MSLLTKWCTDHPTIQPTARPFDRLPDWPPDQSPIDRPPNRTTFRQTTHPTYRPTIDWSIDRFILLFAHWFSLYLNRKGKIEAIEIKVEQRMGNKKVIDHSACGVIYRFTNHCQESWLWSGLENKSTITVKWRPCYSLISISVCARISTTTV